MGRFVLTVVMAWFAAQAGTPEPPVSISPPSAATRPAAPDLHAMPLDDLIGRLPPVEAERLFDPDTRDWTTDEAVLEMAQRLKSGVELSAEQWQRALTRTGILTIRRKWPVGSPVIACMRDSEWLPFTEIRLTPRDRPLWSLKGGTRLWETCGNAADERMRSQMSQSLGAFPLGKHELVFDAVIERGNGTPGGPLTPGILWQGPLLVDFEIVPTLDDAIPPAQSAELDDAVRRSLGVCIRSWGDKDKNAAILVLDADVPSFPALAATAISADVELLRDGQVKSKQCLIAHHYDSLLGLNSIYKGPGQLFAFQILKAVVDQLQDAEEARRWSIRVTGTNRDILHLWHANQYWNGSCEVPLAQAIALEQARMAGKQERLFIWMP